MLHQLHCLEFEENVRTIRVFGFGLGKISSMWLCSALDGLPTWELGTARLCPSVFANATVA